VSKVPSTLAELVAPLSEEEFLTLLRARKLTLLRGVGGERYSALLTWPALLQMIARGEHPSSLAEFVLVKESQVAPPERWLKPNSAGEGNVVDVSKLLVFLNHGFSLSVARINDYAPHLKVLCQNIRSALHEQIKVGAIVTTGKGGAFKLHFDPEDLIILQVEGRKRWKIFGPPVVNPVAGMKSTVTPPPEDTLLFDEILEAGDFLFLPAGNWHRCENESPRSLHLGIFFQPPNGLDVAKALTSKFLSDEQIRMPLTRHDDALSALEKDIKTRAMERIAEFDLRAFLSDFGGQ
jgi:Cupin superfamily protein